MANKHLKLESHRVNNDFWWYEEAHGISLMTEQYDGSGFGNRIIKEHRIPWKAIRAALARKDKK